MRLPTYLSSYRLRKKISFRQTKIIVFMMANLFKLEDVIKTINFDLCLILAPKSLPDIGPFSLPLISAPVMSFKSRPGRELQAGLEKAEAAGVDPEVIKTLTSSRDMFKRQDEFNLDSTSHHSETLAKVEHETYHHDWQGDFDQGKIPWVYKPVMFCGRQQGTFLRKRPCPIDRVNQFGKSLQLTFVKTQYFFEQYW